MNTTHNTQRQMNFCITLFKNAASSTRAYTALFSNRQQFITIEQAQQPEKEKITTIP